MGHILQSKLICCKPSILIVYICHILEQCWIGFIYEYLWITTNVLEGHILGSWINMNGCIVVPIVNYMWFVKSVPCMHPHFWCTYFSLELFCLYNIRIVRPFWLIMLLQLGGFEHKNQYYDFTTVHSNTLNNYIPMSLSFLSDSNNQ